MVSSEHDDDDDVRMLVVALLLVAAVEVVVVLGFGYLLFPKAIVTDFGYYSQKIGPHTVSLASKRKTFT